MAPRLRASRAFALVLLLVVLLPRPAHAGWPNDPSINVRVATAANGRGNVEGCTDGAGGAILCWADRRTGVDDIYAQHVSASGRILWGSGGVDVCAATGQQWLPRIVSDGAGGAFITWWDSRSGNDDIYVQHLAANGKNTWTDNGVVLCNATNYQRYPVLVADGEGGVIVAWEDMRNGNLDVYAQKIDADGAVQWAANGVGVCTAAGTQDGVSVVTDRAGGAVFVWGDQRTGSREVYAQRIFYSGTNVWAANGVVLCASGQVMGDVVAVSDGAGGAIATWCDDRGTDPDIYAQRVDRFGAVQWSANGIDVCTETGTQYWPTAASNGTGGAVIAWNDSRMGADEDIYAQNVSAAGLKTWGLLSGMPVCTAEGTQRDVRLLADAAGRVVVSWLDTRGASYDLYAQRLTLYGEKLWTTSGLPVCVSANVSLAGGPVADGAGGAILSWSDTRGGTYADIYAQRVDQWGYLGAQPTISRVRDVVGDQGGQVKVSWNASPLDSFPYFSIATYRVYRSVPEDLAARALREGATLASASGSGAPLRPGALLARTLGTATTYWEYLGSVSASQMPGYSYIAATECDSMAGSNPRTLFMVEARVSDGTQWWYSDADSGYSVDDLAPSMPAPFEGAYADGVATMSWGQCTASDFAEYRLYRGHGADFVPAADNLVATQTSTAYVDAAGAPYYYKVCAVDIHGNVSPYATMLPSGTADVGDPALPRELALSAPAPNPLRTTTTLRLALPRQARVALTIYDQQGRRVRSLLGGMQPAGERTIVWDGRDERGRPVGCGIYFARCQAEGRTFTRRIVTLR